MHKQKLYNIGIHILFWIMFQGMYWGRKIFNLNIKGIDLEACFYLEHGLEFIVHFIHFYFLVLTLNLFYFSPLSFVLLSTNFHLIPKKFLSSHFSASTTQK